MRPIRAVLALAAAAVVATSACGTSSPVAKTSSTGSGKSGTAGAAVSTPVTLHLGYFPNLTHATPIVGLAKGFFAQQLGSSVHISTATFNAGTSAAEALLSGALDATYIGPNPAINSYAKSHGAVVIVAGAASGGAALVVRSGITSVNDLRGKKIATPQLANTQDVALRYFLLQHGLRTDPQGGGDVHVVPEDNSQTLQAFAQGSIDGAWVPEPYATRLVKENGAHVLVDEASQWPGGKFVVTSLLVRKAFLTAHPDVIQHLIAGQVAANGWIAANPAAAQQIVNAGIQRLTGKQLKPSTLAAAWAHVTFTNDPVASSLRESAAHAEQLGLLKHVDLSGIYDLSLLNKVLAQQHEPAVAA